MEKKKRNKNTDELIMELATRLKQKHESKAEVKIVDKDVAFVWIRTDTKPEQISHTIGAFANITGFPFLITGTDTEISTLSDERLAELGLCRMQTCQKQT